MSINYVYWDIDTTNWNAVYAKYDPLFTQLDINNEVDVKKSVQLFREVCQTLIDGHFYIKFTQRDIVDSSVYPAYDRKQKGARFHNPYPYFTVVKNYLDKNFLEGSDNISDPSSPPLYCLSGTIDRKALYFYASSFNLFKSVSSDLNNEARPIINNFINSLKSIPPGIKGVIVDLRNNPGGDLNDLNFFAGSFINKQLHFGYTKHKTGNGPLYFSPWIKAYVSPRSGANQVNLPIFILVDQHSGSLTELVAMALKCLPNSHLIGETTWGATGPLTSNDVYNDGQFSVNGFLSVTTSSVSFKYLDNKSYESIGFPVDISIPFDRLAFDQGRDLQLESALSYIQ